MMATADSVKSKIQNLIASANSATGQADADMTSAVASLIAGFGGSGSSGSSLITGTYITSERVVQNLVFPTPGGVSNFVMFLRDDVAKDTGMAFCVAYLGNKDTNQMGISSNNSGTAVSSGYCFDIEEEGVGYYYKLMFGTDNVTLIAPLTTEKYVRAPLAGKTYVWLAW